MSALSCACAAVLLAACGGGGSDTATDTSAQGDAELLARSSVNGKNASTGSTTPGTSTGSTTTSPTTDTALVTATASPSTTYTATNHLYVATTGSDSNAGTQAAPFKSISKAASVAKPDTIVHVAPGTYVGGVTTGASGLDGARIYYVSDVKWGAKIVPGSTETIGWRNSGNHVTISGFDIDGSSTSSWRIGVHITGSHATVENSHVHNVWSSSAQGCDSNGGGGIVSDGYSGQEDHRVLNNVVDHIGFSGCGTISGIYMQGAYTDVKNNLVYAIGSDGIVFYHDGTRANIGNNTVFNSNRGIILSAGGIYHLTTAPDYFNVFNNIVYDNASTGIGEGSGPLGIGQNNYYYNNLVFGNGTNMSLTTASQPHESGTVYAAPQFVNYVRTGGGDYRLNSTSPAIDKGSPTNAPTLDLNGIARPQGGAVDIGAYEWTTASTSTGTTPGTTTTTTSPTTGTNSGTSSGTTTTTTSPTTGTTSGTPSGTTTTTTSPTTSTTSGFTATNHLYVATTGSDSNPGTKAAPFKTIAKASSVAKPDTIVHVASGTYTGGLSTTASGTATGRIYYVSDVLWGAKLVPGSGSSVAWNDSGSYTTISGFDVDGQGGTAWRIGLRMAGSYSVLQNNHVHNIYTSGTCDSNGGAGIVTDGYYKQHDHAILNNTVDHVGFSGCGTISGIYGQSAYMKVKNNLVYAIGSDGIVFYHDATNVDVINNTVFNADRGIIMSANGFYNLITAPDYFNVHNNIVVNNRGTGIGEGAGPLGIGSNNTYRNNLVYGNGGSNLSLTSGSSTRTSGTVSADPQFMNYVSTGGGDYRLKSTSPAINKGATTYAPTTDINGVSRPQGGGIDIGAYEYIAQ